MPGIRVPKPATLKIYGLSSDEWLDLLSSQGNVCAICKRVPQSGRWVTDHQHVPKWKKMKPAERRRYVRGIICPFCNSHCVGRFMTLFKAENIVVYLEAYEKRRESSASFGSSAKSSAVEDKSNKDHL